MNWGKALALALIAFAAMMAWFMIQASQHPSPLVTEDYYGAELKYQQRIDAAGRANALTAAVDMDLQRTTAVLRFPAELKGSPITATLTLLRPNDPQADRVLRFNTDSAAHHAGNLDLSAGRYNAALEWEAGGVKYFTEQKVYVP